MAERELHDFSQDPEMESRLRSARPRPDIDFVSRLEGELFATARAPRRGLRGFSLRPAFVAGVAVAAIALLTLVFDLAGIGPFSGDDAPVQAGDNCRTIVVTKRERTPVVVHQNGKDVVRFQMRPVKRHVKRCH
jgi:hypothetical protein